MKDRRRNSWQTATTKWTAPGNNEEVPWYHHQWNDWSCTVDNIVKQKKKRKKEAYLKKQEPHFQNIFLKSHSKASGKEPPNGGEMPCPANIRTLKIKKESDDTLVDMRTFRPKWKKSNNIIWLHDKICCALPFFFVPYPLGTLTLHNFLAFVVRDRFHLIINPKICSSIHLLKLAK